MSIDELKDNASFSLKKEECLKNVYHFIGSDLSVIHEMCRNVMSGTLSNVEIRITKNGIFIIVKRCE